MADSAPMVRDIGPTSPAASFSAKGGQKASIQREESSCAEESPRPEDKEKTNLVTSGQNDLNEASDSEELSRLQKLEQTVAELEVKLKLGSKEVDKQKKGLRDGEATATDASSVSSDESATPQLSTKIQKAMWNPSDEFGYESMSQFNRSVLTAFYGTATGGVASEESTIKTQADDIPEAKLGYTDLKRVQINSQSLLVVIQRITGKGCATPATVFAPWKLFICFEAQMQAYLDRRKVEFNTRYGASDPLNEARVSTEDNQESSENTKPRQGLVSRALAQSFSPARWRIAEEISHLQCLLDFIHTELGHLLELKSQARQGTLTAVPFEYVRHVFDPGDVLLASSDRGQQAYRLYFISGGRERVHSEESQDSRVKLNCFCLYFNGSNIGPRNVQFVIRPYHGERRITELGVYPARFHESSERHMGMLVQRGLRFREICFGDTRGHKTYNGLTIGRDPEMVCGEVYVDFDTGLMGQPEEDFGKMETPDEDYAKAKPRPPSLVTLFQDRWVELALWEKLEPEIRPIYRVMEPEDDTTDEARLNLLPRDVLGYVFRSRAWRQLDVNIIKDIDYSEDARDKGFEQLVIPDSHRNLLLALVNNHPSGPKSHGDASSQARLQMDLVKGKGTGLILLLHGPPGVGKTSTAETIASYTCRPLYPITCGDLGATPKEVEESLAHHFSLAHRWGCVLLLDEADVFLAKRDRDDVVRNGLVSVFLRTLEYYSGILFLTTNRVGVIDEAFKSRIHVSLRYPSLGRSSTIQIWEKTLDRIKDENKDAPVKVEFEKNDLLEWASNHYREHKKTGTTWNGRQIRNAFQTSMALAQYDRAKFLKKKKMTDDDAIKKGKAKYLTVELLSHHFDLVAATAKDFEKYMVAVRQGDAEVAKQEQLRNDEYDPAVSQHVRKNYGASKQISTKGIVEKQGTRKGAGQGKQKNVDRSSSSEEDGFPATRTQQDESDTSIEEE